MGLRVAAVDKNPDALGLKEADIAKVVDFSDVDAVLKATARLHIDGVLTVSADRAVPIVAAVAEARGLPGIGVETAHLLTHKVAMRARLADAGVPQPRFAAVRSLSERRRAADEVGFPAVLKPADSGGQRVSSGWNRSTTSSGICTRRSRRHRAARRSSRSSSRGWR